MELGADKVQGQGVNVSTSQRAECTLEREYSLSLLFPVVLLPLSHSFTHTHLFVNIIFSTFIFLIYQTRDPITFSLFASHLVAERSKIPTTTTKKPPKKTNRLPTNHR